MKLAQFLLVVSISLSCEANKQKPFISDCSFLSETGASSRLICGQLEVPENHDKPDGRKINIAFVILKSEDSSTTNYPMIHFTGGPGGPALTNIERHLSNPILKSRDIIRFDQRGIAFSSALPDLTSKSYDLISQDLSSDEEYDKMKVLISDLRSECDERGIEIEMYNTFQSGKDVGMLMDHLGYEKYNLRGTSYGTRIARVVADMFPQKIHAAIYDSPAPQKNDYLLTRLEDYSSALRKVLDYCERIQECNNLYPNLEQDYFEVLDEIATDPIVATYNSKPYYLNPQDAIFMLRKELYRSDSRERVPKYIKALKNRDMEWINSVLVGRGGTSANYAMFLACENYEEYDHQVTEKVIQQKYDDLKMLPYELALFTPLYKSSNNFLKSYATKEMLEFKVSLIPSLIFINQFDPVTPPENASIFQSKMSDSRAFIINAGGHAGGDMVCKRSMMDAFMDNPQLELNSDCLDLWSDD